MAAFIQDLRYGVRLLFRHRGFTVVAALVLAFGIGANTAVFTIINSLVLKPRPGVPDSELAGSIRAIGPRPTPTVLFLPELHRSARQAYLRVADRDTFSLMGLTEGTGTKRVFADVITANYFDTFGVPVLRGRGFTIEEERPGANIPVTVISHGLWQRLGGTDRWWVPL